MFLFGSAVYAENAEPEIDPAETVADIETRITRIETMLLQSNGPHAEEDVKEGLARIELIRIMLEESLGIIERNREYQQKRDDLALRRRATF